MKAENEYRVIGPPGTGKTTYLSQQVARAVDAGRRPLITSLTRAAAVEIGSRIEVGWDFSGDQIGTLHSHCFRALSCPQLISKAEHIDDWNKYAKPLNPAWELSLGAFVSNKAEEGQQRAALGDSLYAVYNIFRAKLTPVELWPIEVQAFARKFREWRLLAKVSDFTDLVETAVKEQVPVPMGADVIFVDEAQDHDRLELSLVRRWAEEVDQLIVCGDPDQNLYEFRGAEPEAFYDHEIPESHYIVLKQSYRVPAAAHEEAMRMIGRVPDRRPVEYLPREERGKCDRLWVQQKNPHQVVEFAQEIAAQGRSVMLLASCEYMLMGIIKFMRDAGVPFHNPYAPSRGQFNPLGDRAGISSPQRLLALLRCDERFYGEDARRWTWSEFNAWLDPIAVEGLLVRGAKKKVEDIAAKSGEAVVDLTRLRELLDPATGMDELRKVQENPLGWFSARLNKSRAKAFDFPLAVIERRGVRALTERPQIIVGTIHSVKGGQADVVVLFPDLSPQGVDTLSRNPASIYRSFYVGMTRAREELYLAQNSSGAAIRW